MPREMMTVRLDRQVRLRLVAAARRRRRTPSDLTRDALEAWLDAQEATAGATPYEAPGRSHRVGQGRRPQSLDEGLPGHRRLLQRRRRRWPMILIDAGPMVALVDASDQHHASCAEALRGVREPLGTVWPALTEAMDLLLDLPRGQEAVWEMVDRRVVRLLDLGPDDVPRIRELMAKYSRPPDGPGRRRRSCAWRSGTAWRPCLPWTAATSRSTGCNGRRRFRILDGRNDRGRPVPGAAPDEQPADEAANEANRSGSRRPCGPPATSAPGAAPSTRGAEAFRAAGRIGRQPVRTRPDLVPAAVLGQSLLERLDREPLGHPSNASLADELLK